MAKRVGCYVENVNCVSHAIDSGFLTTHRQRRAVRRNRQRGNHMGLSLHCSQKPSAFRVPKLKLPGTGKRHLSGPGIPGGYESPAIGQESAHPDRTSLTRKLEFYSTVRAFPKHDGAV